MKASMSKAKAKAPVLGIVRFVRGMRPPLQARYWVARSCSEPGVLLNQRHLLSREVPFLCIDRQERNLRRREPGHSGLLRGGGVCSGRKRMGVPYGTRYRVGRLWFRARLCSEPPRHFARWEVFLLLSAKE